MTCLHPQAASAARHSVDPSRSVPLSTAISLDMDQLIMQKRLGHQQSQWNFHGDGQTQMQPLRYQHIVLQPEINDTRIQAAFLKAEPRPWNLSWRKTWRCFWTKAQSNVSSSCSSSYASDFSIDFLSGIEQEYESFWNNGLHVYYIIMQQYIFEFQLPGAKSSNCIIHCPYSV